MSSDWDALIVGGGPAGLSAALILGRSRRRVVVFDNGRQRNRRSAAMHGYLTRDGIPPDEFLTLARAELQPYGVQHCETTVRKAERTEEGGFVVETAQGERLRGRKMLLATGVSDRLPEVPGTEELYGVSIHHCPYCDGWEHRNGKLAVYSRGGQGAGLANSLLTWSADVMLLTDGPARIDPKFRHIPVRRGRIARFEGRDGRMTRVVFENGETLEREGLFFATGQDQHCALANDLGCQFSRKGAVETNLLQESCVPGLYVAGDASRDVQLVIVAAAEGAKAGFAINSALQQEELALRARQAIP